MTPAELHALQDPAVLALIEQHEHDDPTEFALRFSGKSGLPVRAMAEQIACRRKAAAKLPALSRQPLLYTKLGLEQASGEKAATWKAGLMQGRRIIDLTGGLGIDSIFFSGKFEQVVSCERDAVLAELSAWNLARLGITNVETRIGESAGLLDGYPDDAFDWIYVDPARREGGRRSVGLETTSPDVVALHDLMLRKAPKVCVKASPALEISGLDLKLPALDEVVVVSVEGECKEVLLLLVRERDRRRPVMVRAVCISEEGNFELSEPQDRHVEKRVAAAPGAWLYEPDAAIIKARLVSELASRLDLRFINRSVDYLTSDNFIDAFPGRSFCVEECLPFRQKSFGDELARRGIGGAAIQRRDFPLSPEEIRKRFRLGESSEVYLFFTRDAMGDAVCLVCRKPDGGLQ
jgi:hypothetical protein